MGVTNRVFETLTWVFLVFVAGLLAGYFWCVMAFGLF